MIRLTDPDSINSPKIQSGLIGLFVQEFLSSFHTGLMIELEQGLMEQGKLLSVNFPHSDPEREINLLRTLARQRLEALIYFTSPLVVSSETHTRTVASWINRYVERRHPGTLCRPLPAGLRKPPDLAGQYPCRNHAHQ
ncbi:type 1 periplasmic-binding domain-containing protein [Pontiella sulfatireligans]|uniref:Uncharacterized protein n=1 Tax=Pontiella sulfatireligans TaxID=2750658 RepID=A0A6C2URT9_9BACT|nr:LacI family DNA-binding transcriptional regulator [Pontiella sulfatireligans]VGO21961.1 hypothetical protein SCARR_04041 [Pontiella sulfatireligans]